MIQHDSQQTFAALGDKAFVSLTTFNKIGERILTPVWVARDGDALIAVKCATLPWTGCQAKKKAADLA